MQAENVIISEGYRPFWHNVAAAALYTLAILLLAMFFFDFEIVPKKGISAQWDFNAVFIAIGCVVQGIVFSSVRSIYLDLNTRKYKKEYRVGPLKTGRWVKLPIIDYVSVFKQPKRDGNFVFETNLWYLKNKHFNIYESNAPEPAFTMGKSIAMVLKIDLLDATRANNQRWVSVEDITLE